MKNILSDKLFEFIRENLEPLDEGTGVIIKPLTTNPDDNDSDLYCTLCWSDHIEGNVCNNCGNDVLIHSQFRIPKCAAHYQVIETPDQKEAHVFSMYELWLEHQSSSQWGIKMSIDRLISRLIIVDDEWVFEEFDGAEWATHYPSWSELPFVSAIIDNRHDDPIRICDLSILDAINASADNSKRVTLSKFLHRITAFYTPSADMRTQAAFYPEAMEIIKQKMPLLKLDIERGIAICNDC